MGTLEAVLAIAAMTGMDPRQRRVLLDIVVETDTIISEEWLEDA